MDVIGNLHCFCIWTTLDHRRRKVKPGATRGGALGGSVVFKYDLSFIIAIRTLRNRDCSQKKMSILIWPMSSIQTARSPIASILGYLQVT